jgi:hypothetical protein
LSHYYPLAPLVRLTALGCASLLALSSLAIAQTTPTATTELAVQHVFARLADGEKAPSWNTRIAPLKNIGLAPAQIELTVNAASTFMAAARHLATQAAAIHKRLKDKTLSQASGIQQLKGLDQTTDGLIVTAIAKLKLDLGPDGWSAFETYLNNTVKPSIVFLP